MSGGESRVNRRRLLQFVGGAGVGLLAGCGGDSGTPTVTSSPTPDARSVFQEVSFDGGEMVVQLSEDHEVSRVNLIDPDGELFRGTSVAAGAMTVRLEILDIQPLGAGYEHYEPGEYELVAVSGVESISMAVELRPDLRIVDVRQYRDGEGGDYGRLAVDVENTGTAPTWVHHITYEDAPYYGANSEPLGDSGVILLTEPSDPSRAVIGPNSSKTYVSTSIPLLYVDQENQECKGVEEFTILVEQVVSKPLITDVRVTVSGEVIRAGLSGEYTCSNSSVEILNRD